jgi:hypothetical protein
MNATHKLFILLFLLVACSCSNDNLRFVLEQSGSNRAELEQVLHHYPEGSQKRQAAEFLIGNMLYQHYAGDVALANYREVLIQAELALDFDPNYPERIDTLWDSVNAIEKLPELERDMVHIKADYLINDIDLAFSAWENAVWKDSITFDIFLHYILPYKTSQEPLYPFRAQVSTPDRGNRQPQKGV